MSEHTMNCGVCGKPFDMRDLDQVVAHEHHGPRLATGVYGEITREESDRLLRIAFVPDQGWPDERATEGDEDGTAKP